jgi:hypothetical protein
MEEHLTLKRPNSPKFSALNDQISQRNSKKIHKQKLLRFIMIIPDYNEYEFNSALEELNKNGRKKIGVKKAFLCRIGEMLQILKCMQNN